MKAFTLHLRDDEAVEHSEAEPEGETKSDAEPRIQPGVHQASGEHPGHREKGPDRQVYSAGDDDHGDPDAHDGDGRHAAKDVEDVQRLQEILAGKAHHDDEDQEGKKDSHLPVGERSTRGCRHGVDRDGLSALGNVIHDCHPFGCFSRFAAGRRTIVSWAIAYKKHGLCQARDGSQSWSGPRNLLSRQGIAAVAEDLPARIRGARLRALRRIFPLGRPTWGDFSPSRAEAETYGLYWHR